MKINIFKTEDEVIFGLAEYFVKLVNEVIETKGRCVIALSGGTSPKRLYELLSSPFFKDQIRWQMVDFFFGDERYVPPTDSQSNFQMVNNALFEPLQINPSHIFAVDTSLRPEESAKNYEAFIRNYFKKDPLQFDIILLGLGDNAHTASLFPHTPVLNEINPSVRAVFLQDQQVHRITLNAPLINQAHNIIFLVYGSVKAIAVHQVIEGAKNIHHFPAQLIKTDKGNLQWFLDATAASGLSAIN